MNAPVEHDQRASPSSAWSPACSAGPCCRSRQPGRHRHRACALAHRASRCGHVLLDDADRARHGHVAGLDASTRVSAGRWDGGSIGTVLRPALAGALACRRPGLTGAGPDVMYASPAPSCSARRRARAWPRRSRRSRPRTAAASIRCWRAPGAAADEGLRRDVPQSGRPGRRPGQERRAHRRAAGAGLRLRRDRHDHAAAAGGQSEAAHVPPAASTRR